MEPGKQQTLVAFAGVVLVLVGGLGSLYVLKDTTVASVISIIGLALIFGSAIFIKQKK